MRIGLGFWTLYWSECDYVEVTACLTAMHCNIMHSYWFRTHVTPPPHSILVYSISIK